jgi:hypothetical protein
VNREVRPDLKGVTLARVTTVGEGRQLNEVASLREYQLTLRNTSKVHLQNVEIQFDFPTEDVQAWASRPVRSNTALLPMNASPSDPWKKAFRWNIPHLPSGDSVEFTFQAVAPPTNDYVAALYNSERVVVERVTGEPRASSPDWMTNLGFFLQFIGVAGISGIGLYWLMNITVLHTYPFEKTEFQKRVTGSGCDLFVKSNIRRNTEWQTEIWEIEFLVMNAGRESCVVNWTDGDFQGRLDPGVERRSSRTATNHPRIVKSSLSFSSTGRAPANVEIDTFLP